MFDFLYAKTNENLQKSTSKIAPALKSTDTEKSDVSSRHSSAHPEKSQTKAGVLYESPAERAACEAEAACNKLTKDYLNSIVQIVGDRRAGTGWIGPDGRVITAAHVVEGNKRLVAIDQKGKRYRLGENSTVDHATDLAALDFVGGRPTIGKPLTLAERAPRVGEIMYSLNHKGLKPLQLQRGTFVSTRTGFELDDEQDKEGKSDLYLRNLARMNPVEYKLLSQQLSRKLDIIDIGARKGSSGGPVFNSDGAVSSVIHRGSFDGRLNMTTRIADVEALLKKPATHSVRLESSASLFLQDASRLEKGALGFKVGMAAIGGEALRTGVGGRLTPIVAGALLLNQGVSDIHRINSSQDLRDRIKYGYACGSDSLMLVGLVTKVLSKRSAVGLGILGAGALMRASAELIPNEYVFGKKGS
jgi:S1-C subfamily serine protease